MLKRISSWFPTYGLRNIQLYYLVVAFSGAWFIIGNWLFFALKYVTAYEMSVVEALSFGVGLLLEVPSGAIADLFGKKRTVQLGLFMQILGMILFTFAHISVWMLIIGNIIIIAAFAFISGSLEALAYDTLVEHKKEDKFDKVVSRIGVIYPVVFVFAAITGGLMWKFNIYLPFIASILSFMVAFFYSFEFTEPKVDTYTFTFKKFITQNVQGFKQLTNINLLHYVPIFVVVSAAYYMWSVGIIRIVMGEEFGYDGETLSYLIGIVMLVSSVIVHHFDSIKLKLGNKRGLIIVLLGSALGWFIAGITNNYIAGAVVFFLLTIFGQLHIPWVSSMLNKHVPSELRATSISTLQFMVQIPYVLVVIYFGSLVNDSLTGVFYLGVSAVILFALGISFLLALSSHKRLL